MNYKAILMLLRLCAIVGNCAFPKDKMRKQDESKKHRKYEESASDSGKKWATENEK